MDISLRKMIPLICIYVVLLRRSAKAIVLSFLSIKANYSWLSNNRNMTIYQQKYDHIPTEGVFKEGFFFFQLASTVLIGP